MKFLNPKLKSKLVWIFIVISVLVFVRYEILENKSRRAIVSDWVSTTDKLRSLIVGIAHRYPYRDQHKDLFVDYFTTVDAILIFGARESSRFVG